jgi:hypothetical protein
MNRRDHVSIIPELNVNGNQRIYNCTISRLPENQLKFMTLPATTSPIAAVDLRSKFPPVYDQGNLGSCTANALCAAFAYAAPGYVASRLFLYYNERLLENDISHDAGAYIHDGIKALEKYGVCTEAIWPYITHKYAVKPPPACYTAALSDRVLTAQNIQPTLTAMRQALFQGYPFVFGIQVYSSFETAAVSANGIVPLPGPNDKLLGGHALVAVGYDDNKKWFIVRNSWGAGWGSRGYGFIPYAYLTNPSLTSDLWYISSVKK